MNKLKIVIADQAQEDLPRDVGLLGREAGQHGVEVGVQEGLEVVGPHPPGLGDHLRAHQETRLDPNPGKPDAPPPPFAGGSQVVVARK